MANSIDSEWEDITPQNDSDWEDVTPQSQVQKPGIIQQTMDRTGMSTSPMGLLGQVPELLSKGASKLGERVSTEFAQHGIKPLFARESIPVSPEVAAGIGTAVSMTPDIVMAAGSPIDASKTAVKAAIPAARRALGFQKSFLKTPFARGQATKAAETALEQDIIPLSGSPETMFQRASNLKVKSGRPIGEALDRRMIGRGNVQKAFDDLESLRPQIAQGMEGGLFEGANNAISKVQENIVELLNKPNARISDLNKIKSRLGQSLNYLGDLASQSDNKAIQTALANSIRDMVKGVLPEEEFVKYLNNQKLYGASQLMLKGLNNEMAGQMGNKALSIPSTVMGASRLAAGDIPGALTATGVTEGLMRRGMGATAKTIQSAGKAIPTIGIAGATQTAKPMLKKRKLDDQTAQELFEEAGRDPEKARELAKERGFYW